MNNETYAKCDFNQTLIIRFKESEDCQKTSPAKFDGEILRNIAAEPGINRESVRQIAKRELNLNPFQLQKVQLLTDNNKCDSKDATNFFVGPHVSGGAHPLQDEKLFSVEQAHIHQNDNLVRRGSRHITHCRPPPKSSSPSWSGWNPMVYSV